MLYGGRGAGRSWGVARALLLLGAQRTIRVLCARELQNSIAESVHKLLGDQIDLMGLDGFYDIQVGKIIGANGTTFAFEGIKNNARKIKSYEGIDYCWVEEAEAVSEDSWTFLIPTIRKAGSEIWITFNPNLEKDYTFQEFVVRPDQDTVVVKMTWEDNPWFPEDLRREKDALKAKDYNKYLNVWEGFPKQALSGAVYETELQETLVEGRVGKVPYDRMIPVDTFWDLGRRDQTAIWFSQTVAMQHRMLAYHEDTGKAIHAYIKHLQSLPYVYGTHWLPHDAKARVLGTQHSIQEIMIQAFGPDHVRLVPKLGLTDGINAARMVFPNVWFDSQACEIGLDRLKNYRYALKEGQRSEQPVHDANSNGADSFRYFAVATKNPVRRGRGVVERLAAAASAFRSRDDISPQVGWMA